MEALASPLSLLIKGAPGKGAQAETWAGGMSAGEIPQDVFAALLAQQLGAAGGEIPPPDALPDAQARGGAELSVSDPALTPEQLAAQPLATPFVLPAQAAEAVAQAPARSPDIALVGSAVSAAVGQGQTARDAAAASPAVEPEGVSARQAVAAEPASFAATLPPQLPAQASDVAVEAVTQAHGKELAFELPAPARADNLPTPAAASQFALPLTPARADAPQPAASIPQPVTSDIWGERLGERVVWMVSQQQQNVELHLNPPALGPLEVKLSLSDSQATLTFSTQHAPVREAIENATSRLREMLADSGVSLGSVSVNVGNFNQQQPGQQAAAERQPAWGASFAAASEQQTTTSALVTPLRHRGMVDIFA